MFTFSFRDLTDCSELAVTETYKLVFYLVKVKGKVVPLLFLTEHHAMKAYSGSGGIAPLVL
jgi:hypothetical protein